MEVILNPVISSYIPLIILSLLLSIALDVFLLWRGRWETWTRLANIGTNLFVIYVLYILITGHNAWLVQEGVGGFFSFVETFSESAFPNQESILILGMHAFRLAFIVALIVISVDTVKQVYQLIKRLVSKPVSLDLPGENA